MAQREDDPSLPAPERLARFLLDLYGFGLEGLTQHRDELPFYEYSEPLFIAWERERSGVDRAVELLRIDLQGTGQRSRLSRELERHGLNGVSLNIKLRIFYDTMDAYRERPTPVRFGDVLTAGDIMLGSLAPLVPGLDGFKEIKEAVERLFQWGRGPFRKWLRRRRR